jgi:predicted AlkP superfamily phosphohydrolase/phosphomutase
VLFHGPSVFRFGYSTDASNFSFGMHMLEEHEQPDLFATLFVLGDIAGHVFWHHYEPERFADFDEAQAHLSDAIPSAYRQIDRWTGELIAQLDPATTIVIASDHGMGPEGVVPKPGVNPAGDHLPEGILVVAGPAALRGVDFGDVASIDFTPTVLGLLGLPVAADMPGRAPWKSAGAAEPVVSYGDGRSELDAQPADSGAAGTRSTGEAEYLERLRALGYIK